MRMDLATRPLKEVMLIESFWVGHKSSISGKFVKEHGTDTEGKKIIERHKKTSASQGHFDLGFSAFQNCMK